MLYIHSVKYMYMLIYACCNAQECWHTSNVLNSTVQKSIRSTLDTSLSHILLLQSASVSSSAAQQQSEQKETDEKSRLPADTAEAVKEETLEVTVDRSRTHTKSQQSLHVDRAQNLHIKISTPSLHRR